MSQISARLARYLEDVFLSFSLVFVSGATYKWGNLLQPWMFTTDEWILIVRLTMDQFELLNSSVHLSLFTGLHTVTVISHLQRWSPSFPAMYVCAALPIMRWNLCSPALKCGLALCLVTSEVWENDILALERPGRFCFLLQMPGKNSHCPHTSMLWGSSRQLLGEQHPAGLQLFPPSQLKCRTYIWSR